MSGDVSRDPLIGTTVHDEWTLAGKLGEGGMGAVYRADHRRLPGLRAVVKVLLAEFANNEALLQRFEREALAVTQLRHEHIITLQGYGRLPDGQPYILMPLLEGVSLDQHIRQSGKLTPQHTLWILTQLGAALHHAHARGVIHRDLKPQNVFLEGGQRHEYFAKLLDFGIAKVQGVQEPPGSGPQTRTGSAVGTPSFMAVEQYEDAAHVTPATDVFALAVIVWTMLTGGELPWGIHDERVLYFKQKTEMPVFPPEVPAAWQPVLRAALSPDPARRPPSVQAFILGLASGLPGQPPFVRSGAEIVRHLAPELIKDAPPTLDTVRANGDAAAPIFAPLPGEGAGAVAPAALPFAAPAPSAATIVARPVPATPPLLPQQQTTLGASSGVSMGPVASVRGTRRWLVPTVGLTIVMVGIVAFGLVHDRARHAASGAGSVPMDAEVPSATASPNGSARPATTERTHADAGVRELDAAQTVVPVSASPDAMPTAPIHLAPSRGIRPRHVKQPEREAPATPARPATRTSVPAKPRPGQPGGSNNGFDPDGVGG